MRSPWTIACDRGGTVPAEKPTLGALLELTEIFDMALLARLCIRPAETGADRARSAVRRDSNHHIG
ncbi:hypothetical protein GCM10009736_68830 [Actinomadura bangladeshensis]